MDAPSALDAAGLLRAVADTTEDRPRLEPASVPLDHFHWVAPCSRLFQPDPLGSFKTYDWSGLDGQASLAVDRELGDRLAAVRALRPGVAALRVGWLFLAGPAPDGRRLFHPVVSVPVKVSRGSILGPAHLAPAGDAILSPALPAEARRTLAEQLHFGGPQVAACADPAVPARVLGALDGLRKFTANVADALGLPALRLVPADAPPDALRQGDELVAVAGFAVYAVRDEDPDPQPAPSLARWLGAAERRDTALAALLGRPAPSAPPPDDAHEELSPLPLSGRQRAVVRYSRTRPLTIVSGVTGTGKTTTAVAVAVDAVARGERVLVVARAADTTDHLIEALLERSPVPPVAFGSTDRRAAVLARLVEARAAVPVADVAEAAVARDRSREELRRRRDSVARELRAEQAWMRRRHGQPVPERLIAPGLFTPSADLERAAQLSDLLARPGAGPRRRWRLARARRRLARLAGTRRRTSAAELRALVDAAVAESGADVLQAIGGVDLESAWARLAAVDALARAELARWWAIEARHHDAAGRSRLTILRTIGEVHRALRNGRSLRRLQLSQVSTVRLTTVLPVWVGQLADVEEILPLRFGLFDLIIVEEATSTSAVLAAPALLRGRRAVVLGDPLATSPAGDPALHSLAASTGAPTVVLDHQFVARPEVAGGTLARLAPAVHPARPPQRGTGDVLEVVRVEDGAAATEEVLARVAATPPPAGGVAVVAVDAGRVTELERRILGALTVDEIERRGLVVGSLGGLPTIRAESIVADLVGHPADGTEASGAAWALLGRARERIAMVHDGGPGAAAVVAALQPADAAGDHDPTDRQPADAWTRAVVSVLHEAGFALCVGWLAGGHVVDVATVRPAGPTAILTAIHPDGVDAHIERHLELSTLGWRVIEVVPSRWAERLEKLPDHIDNRWRG